MRTARTCLTFVALLLPPATAFAQASLTGTVRDEAGGVLPGVTVEASSPALIERVRTAVTAQWQVPNSARWLGRADQHLQPAIRPVHFTVNY